MAFDEAHVLSAEKHRFDTGLRRVLRVLYALPIFSVFISTTGGIQNITPRAELDTSGRVQKADLLLLPPFTELGFDQMVRPISDGALTIEEVSTIGFMVRFGRSLWVVKLRQLPAQLIDFIQDSVLDISVGTRRYGDLSFTTPEKSF